MNLDIAESMKLCYRYKDNPLWDFFLNQKHRTIDKWMHYFEIYEKWFSPYRGKDIVMIEIGIFGGGSLQMWKNYFGSRATIIGIDIEESCRKFADEQVIVEIGSQSDVAFWHDIKKKYPQVDILLDDGGHRMDEQIITFKEMFPHLTDGGLYMCEDTHSSYENSFRSDPNEVTYIDFMKTVIDELHAYYKDNSLPIGYNTQNIAGLHFYDSIVVAEKKQRRLPPIDFRYATDEENPSINAGASASWLVKQSIQQQP